MFSLQSRDGQLAGSIGCLAIIFIVNTRPLPNLPYKVIIDTSIQHPISGQATPLVNACMDIMFDMLDTAFSY